MMIVSGPGQNLRASRLNRGEISRASSSTISESRTSMGSARWISRPFGLIDLPHGAQVERIGDQRVKRVGRNGNDAPAANGGSRPIQRFR